MIIDWPNRVITVFQTDSFISFAGGNVWDMDTDGFRRAVMQLEDDLLGGLAYPPVFSHNTTVLLGGIEYARIIEIINGYTITFDDVVSGAYVINLIGSNNNILDVTNLTTVQVRSNNSAGLTNVREIQQDIFGGFITLDVVRGFSGTQYPAGTPLQPCNNLADAVTIGNIRGIDSIRVIGTYVFDATDVVDNFIFQGTSSEKSILSLTPAASITNCIFRECTITGQLDGGNSASFCIVGSLDYIDGSLLDCFLGSGVIVLGGTQANFLRCASAVAGGGPGQLVRIDMGGGGTNVVVRDYNGGIDFFNHPSGSDNVSIDMSSGRVVFENTIASGTYTVRGIADVVDNSTGTAFIEDLTVNKYVKAALKTDEFIALK